jgi:VacB/RNase II family 3'-5' exoribonuclease
MLDLNTLSQLKDLKKQIQDSIPRGTGIVKGTHKRFGFVIADSDSQQYLLPQTEMDKVLPGDHIQYILEKGEKDDEKPIAKIEKLLKSELSRFIGSIVSKKEQMYVVPDHQQFNRWIFIPPKFRKNLKEGDLVAAKISQHPYQHEGRAQAEITALIGQPTDPFIEHRYAIVKEGIEEKIWQADELQAVRQTAETVLDATIPERTDYRALPFFTIDGASTQDLDDALNIEKTSEGWLLHIAIADVSTFVDANSPLDKIASKQACSIYLPGQKIPMLPDVLSSDICSLKPHQDRLALICHLNINADGAITHTAYSEAVIHSKAKLSYDDVAQLLEGKTSSISADIQPHLLELNNLALKRHEWRKHNALLMDDYVDYRYTLNDKGKIIAIEHQERNKAQQLVEECMLACNEATARFIHEHLNNGLFLSHHGFKPDQLSGMEKLLETYLPDFDKSTANTLEGYKTLLRLIENLDCELALKEILRKKLVKSEWKAEHSPHFGLGFDAYTTFTSPIRKYSDLLVHRMVKNIIQAQPSETLNDKTISHLNNAIQSVRNAQRDCEQALKCQYLQQFKGQVYAGEISMINHRVIGVYLPDFDIHGKIEVRSFNIPFTFKQDSLQLNSETLNFKLKQTVSVMIDSIDEAQRNIKLTLVDNASAAA